MNTKWASRLFGRRPSPLLDSEKRRERNTKCEQDRVELFKHKPLQHPWQIRLLELLPQDKPHSVRGKIHLVPGNDAKKIDPNYDVEQNADRIPYNALSYTWGDSKVTEEIQLDGKPFFVTPNLYAFLWQWTPSRDKPSFSIWIDAISIDQANAKERNEQVRRMTSIYESAATVFIWLGPEAENSNLAVRGLSLLATRAPTPGTKPTGEATWQLDNDFILDEKFVLAVKHLLARPWWRRVWIIQEATVPEQSYLVLCGSMTIQWTCLHTALWAFRDTIWVMPELRKFRSFVFQANRREIPFWNIRGVRQLAPKGADLFKLVCFGRQFKASDERDHIFAFLGMTQGESSTLLSPDYETSVNEIYQNFTQYIISTRSYGHNLDILEQVGGLAADFNFDIVELLDDIDQVNSASEKLIMDNTEESLAMFKQVYVPFVNKMRSFCIQALQNPQLDAAMREIFPPQVYSLLHVIPSFKDGHSWLEYLENQAEQIQEHLDAENITSFLASTQQFTTRLKSGPVSVNAMHTHLFPEHQFLKDMDACLSLETLDASLPSQHHTRHELPSWVPLWNKPLEATPFYKVFTHLPDDQSFIYKASGRDPQPFLLTHSSLVNFAGRVLQLRGFRADVIKQVSSLVLTSGNWDSQEEGEAIWVKLQSSVDLNGEIYEATGEKVVDALRRTLTADIAYNANGPIGRLKNLSPDQESDVAASITVLNWSRDACEGRSLATTAGKLIGLVPRLAQVDDEIFVLAGGQVLYVLRPDGDCFQYIGESYVHGLMDGEALGRLRDGTAKVDTIRII